MGLFRNFFSFRKKNHTPLKLSISRKTIYPSLKTRLQDLLTFRKKSLKERIFEKLTFRSWVFVVLVFMIVGIGYLMFGRIVQIYKQASGADPVAYWKFDEGQGLVVNNSADIGLKGYMAYSGSSFATKVDYTTASRPYSVAIGDVNNDGYADLAVANATSTSVSVFINNGDGTFAAKVDYTTASQPYSVAIGDVNNDGYADLAVANVASTSVSVLINDGDGTFAAKVDYTTGSTPVSVAIGDVNNDGYVDLAVANATSTSVSVFINNGDGTFAAKVDYTTASQPYSVAIGDVNNDGYADLAVANVASTSVSVLINDGDGTFAAKVDYTTASQPYSVAIGDVNNDGYVDLAVANATSTSVSVFINNGDGTFAAKVDYTTASQPYSVAIGDVNNDGYADLAVANVASTSVSVLINDGDGTFAAKVDYTTASQPASVAIGDVNNDGYADLAVANYNASSVSVLINTGDSSSWQTEDQCISGKCVRFDGTDDFVSTTFNDISGSSARTISFWVKLHQSGIKHILYNYGSDGPFCNPGQMFSLIVNASNQWVHNLCGGAYDINTGVSAEFNTWLHVAQIYDGTNVKLYINAELKSNTAKSLNTGTDALQIGGRSGYGEYAPATIDEFKVYDYALSESQIKSDYAGGAAAGSSAVLGQEDQSFLSDGLVGYWKMDEVGVSGSNWTAVDSSGNNNNGIGSGNASVGTTAVGKFGNAGYFDGDGDYVKADVSNLPTEDFTYAAWVKQMDGENAGIISISDGSGGNELRILITDNGEIMASVNGSSILSDENAIPINTWTHLILTRKGADTKLYSNGALVGEDVIEGTLNFSSCSLYIGARVTSNCDTTGTSLMGSIDEVRIYNRELTENEVKALYHWAPGPVGWWKLDENKGTEARDTSGGNTSGTVTNAKWTKGKFGSALFFDGSGDYVSMGDATFLDNIGAATFSTWVKFNTLEQDDAIIRKYTSGQQSFVFGSYVNEADELQLGITDGSGNRLLIYTTDANLTVNTWYYITGVWSGGNEAEIYVNGIPKAVSNTVAETPVSINNSSEHLMLGARYKGGSPDLFLDGYIDDVKIYNYARTQAQIVQDMNGGHPAPGSPVGSALLHYRLDEGYGTTINNVGSVGSTLNGTLATGTSAPTWTNEGKYGKALRFDGTNDYVTITDNDSIDIGTSASATVSVWYYSTAEDTTARVILSKRSADTSANTDYNFMTENNLLNWGTGTSSDSCAWLNITEPSRNEWHHVVGTIEATGSTTGTKKLYVDGVLKSTCSYTNKAASNSSPLNIGRAFSSGYWKGSIDEVKFYNFPLTQEQVLVEYNQGKAIVLGAGSTGVGGTSPDNSSSREYCIPGDNSECNSPVGEWLFDEGSGTIAYSTSGTGNGTMNNFTGRFGWSQGKFGGAMLFDGSDDRIEINSSGLIGTDTTFSISAWVYPDPAYSTEGTIYCECNANGATRNFFIVLSDGKIRLDQYEPSGGPMDSTASIPFGQWSHIAYSRNGSTEYLFINGVLDSSSTGVENFSGTILGEPTKTTIGVRYSNTAGNYSLWFNGKIDQLRAYNYYRTPAQIAWEYNQGQPVAWYRLDECTGTTAYNAIKNADGKAMGGNGTITIGSSGDQTSAGTCSSGTGTQAWNNGTTGKFNSSLHFDGVDDYIEIADDPMHELEFPFSITAWIKLDSLPSSTGDHYSIISKYKANTNDREWRFTVTTSSNRLNFLTSTNGSASESELSDTSLTNDLGKWVHVAVSADENGTISFYRNGIYDGGGTFSNTTINTSSSTTTIGAVAHSSTTPDMFFDGQIDEVKIYRYNLTHEQVKTDMAGGAVRFQ